MSNKLYRSNNDKMISGVMGGIAEHFGWDSTWVRIIYVLVSIFSTGFPGIIVYIVLALIIPEKPIRRMDDDNFRKDVTPDDNF